MSKFLNDIGASLTFLGSLCFCRGLFISKKDAIKLGVSRWSGETEEENLKLPQVQDRLQQRRWGIAGAVLVALGFFFQIFGQFL